MFFDHARLAIWVLLNADPQGFFALFAVVCTSFAAINVGTSLRSPVTQFGRLDLKYVKELKFFSLNSMVGKIDLIFQPKHCVINLFGK